MTRQLKFTKGMSSLIHRCKNNKTGLTQSTLQLQAPNVILKKNSSLKQSSFLSNHCLRQESTDYNKHLCADAEFIKQSMPQMWRNHENNFLTNFK